MRRSKQQLQLNTLLLSQQQDVIHILQACGHI